MKWPLRNQIMAPMTAVLTLAIVGLSLTNAYWAAARQRRELERRIGDVARTLARPSFPLTSPSVLAQMKGLAGAEFVLADDQGQIVASTSDVDPQRLPRGQVSRDPAQLRLGGPVELGQRRYFHAALHIDRPTGSPHTLHVLYPVFQYQQQRWQAVFPTVVVGGLALALVVVLAGVIAARVSRPLEQLRRQVDQIAEGEFSPMTLPRRHDEVRELAEDVNRMADMLARFEQQVRQTERLRTLGQLSGALAHQMRNAVTGAKIALDIHQDECPLGAGNESIEVAARQLMMMEKYVKKLLSIGAPAERAHQQLDFGQLVGSLLPLVRPAAQHVGVDFAADLPTAPLLVRGDQDALEHLVLNLMLNGIEAAAAARHAGDGAEPAHVTVRLEDGQDQLLLTVEDTGSGPADDVAQRVFEPFVTDKRDGVGLGLAVAQQVAVRHGGDIRWERAGGRTRFVAQIPLIAERTLRVEAAGG